MFDIDLPVVVLSPVLGYFQPAQVEPGHAVILGSLVFITTLFGRPLGAVLFGLIADRTGRRMASIYSVTGFSIITLLIGLILSYQSIGISSYLLLVTLRFLDGICLGGGYTGAHPLALESSNKQHRGLVGGFIMMTSFWTTQNIVTIFLPSTLLPHMLHLSKVQISVTLLIAPAVAIDMIMRRLGDRNPWFVSLLLGVSFVAVFLAVQWPFGTLQASEIGRSAFLGGSHGDYQNLAEWLVGPRRLWTDDGGWRTTLFRVSTFAVLAATVSSRLGIARGNFLRRVVR